jgi:hypothetical protein
MGGYERYRKTIHNLALGNRYHRMTPEIFGRRCNARLLQCRPARKFVKIIAHFLYLQPDIETLYFDNFAVFTRRMQQELLTDDARSAPV